MLLSYSHMPIVRAYFRETQEIGAYVKYSYEALRAIEEIAVRRGVGVSTTLRKGVITIQIQEEDLQIWIKIEEGSYSLYGR